LRTHQLLSLATLYTFCRHVWEGTTFSKYFAVGIIGYFLLGVSVQVVCLLWHNRLFWHGLPRARIFRSGQALSLIIYTPRPLKVRPGQYINLYIPGVSFWSFLQTHPFYVAFAREHGHGTRLELLIEARHGWTSKVLMRAPFQAQDAEDVKLSSANSYVSVFSGPHGQSVSIGDYGVIILIACGWGLTAQMPYLQTLVRGFHHGTVKAQRIHLIWQLETIGMAHSQVLDALAHNT
jgi:NAD(P)H-flavin reductase